MTTPEDALAAVVEASVLAVPGVTAVFRTGGAASRIADAGARLLGLRDDDSPVVRVQRSSEGVHVEIAIGVLASVGAVETVRLVHTAIAELISQEGAGPAGIRITVVHVGDPTLR